MDTIPCNSLSLPADANKPYCGRRSTCTSPLRFNSIGSEPESLSDEGMSPPSPPPEMGSGRTYSFLRNTK